jgi:hypothetical protein
MKYTPSETPINSGFQRVLVFLMKKLINSVKDFSIFRIFEKRELQYDCKRHF